MIRLAKEPTLRQRKVWGKDSQAIPVPYLRPPNYPTPFMAAPNSTRYLPLVIALIVIAAVSRLIPHPPNFVPTGAMALLGAAALPKKWLAYLVPLVAYYLSDLLLNNTLYAAYFDGFYFGVSPYVYGALALMILLGTAVLRHRAFSWLRIGGAAVGATVVFFLVSNFGVWAGGMTYPKTAAGLLAAFAAGLPFLVNSLLANLLFSGVLFGVAKYAGVFGSEPDGAVLDTMLVGK